MIVYPVYLPTLELLSPTCSNRLTITFVLSLFMIAPLKLSSGITKITTVFLDTLNPLGWITILYFPTNSDMKTSLNTFKSTSLFNANALILSTGLPVSQKLMNIDKDDNYDEEH